MEFMRLRFILVIVLGVLICSSSILYAANSVTTIRWQSYFTLEDRAKLFPSIIKDFEKQHPNIHIEYTGTGNHMDLLKASIAVGDPPELFGVNHTSFLELAQNGQLYDLSPVWKKDNWEKRFYPMTHAWNMVNNKYFGVSANDVFVLVWHYNKDLFRKYNLSEPTNLEELIAVCKKLRQNGVEFPLMICNNPGAGTIAFYGMITAQTAGLDAVYKKDFQNKNLLRATQIYDKLVKEGAVNPACTGIDWPSAIALFGAGKVGILPMHTGVTTQLEVAAGNNFKMGVLVPGVKFVDSPKTLYSAGGGMIWAISTTNKHIKETVLFLEYLMSPKVQAAIAASGEITPDPKANLKLTDPIKLTALKMFGKATADSFMFIDQISSNTADTLNNGLLEMINGKKTPEDVMKAISQNK
jgi:raffinose/stachyose/melibiose transport system substrate-binding protein